MTSRYIPSVSLSRHSEDQSSPSPQGSKFHILCLSHTAPRFLSENKKAKYLRINKITEVDGHLYIQNSRVTELLLIGHQYSRKMQRRICTV